VALETHFNARFAAELAVREKQIQQAYRPIIGIHKWFARRPGTLFRSLLLAEFDGSEPLETSFLRSHNMTGVIADPFMGGGTPIFEANRLGFGVVGTDINPMAFWVVRQGIVPLDIGSFLEAADRVTRDVEIEIGHFYRTRCSDCGGQATVKYFLWVKVLQCPDCGVDNDLFPGYLLAENSRHPRNVLACPGCGKLNEFDSVPTEKSPAACYSCSAPVHVEGPARRGRVVCRSCSSIVAYPGRGDAPPRHRMWAIEYHCTECSPRHAGRFFKKPDPADLSSYQAALGELGRLADELPIPGDPIPLGDETGRLHRWGYARFREMFNERQLLGLGLLLRRICRENDRELRHALLTVFSDHLRYQNMLCRYDTYALKCQDIFSVHGFPVGLVQCENNLLGIPKIGSGSFRHFVEKYRRAKEYCLNPFETTHRDGRKRVVRVVGERIGATLVDSHPTDGAREARLDACSATDMPLAPGSLDGVFTDPPYFDNVQYAELMDFCYVWLRQGLASEFKEFRAPNTRSSSELTGNDTAGRDLVHFTKGLSAVYTHYAGALKPGAPFVFTFHHNEARAYVPLVVAILDAGLDCTATLPAPAEMGASLHISGTGSSVMDSVFVCRRDRYVGNEEPASDAIARDLAEMKAAGIDLTAGDIRCLAAGHTARIAINLLRPTWDQARPILDRMDAAASTIASVETGSATLWADAHSPLLLEVSVAAPV
jgi:adenine-specific DNA methylase